MLGGGGGGVVEEEKRIEGGLFWVGGGDNGHEDGEGDGDGDGRRLVSVVVGCWTRTRAESFGCLFGG